MSDSFEFSPASLIRPDAPPLTAFMVRRQ